MGWQLLWHGRNRRAVLVPPLLRRVRHGETAEIQSRREDEDPHLRSVAEVAGYHVHASDGDIGHVEDLLVEETGWGIRYLIIDTRNW